MTNATVHTTADELSRQSFDESLCVLTALDFDRVQVSFPAEDGGDPVCKHCGETIFQLDSAPAWASAGWATDESGDPEADFACSSRDEDEPHEPDNGPGSWCNSASVSVDESSNEVTVTISVGDPRGAFAMTVRKVDRSGYCRHCGKSIERDPAGYFLHADSSSVVCDPSATWDPNTNDATPDGERLMLHVPYVGMGWAHAELTELHAGTFLVGH